MEKGVGNQPPNDLESNFEAVLGSIQKRQKNTIFTFTAKSNLI